MAIPIVTSLGNIGWGRWLSLLVWVEILILVSNRMRCPLTGIAELYTQDRSDNFDIFLPSWLARNNKLIFGSFFMAAELFLLWRSLTI